MSGILKALLAVTALLAPVAQAETAAPPRTVVITYTDLSRETEAMALAAWPKLAKRDGNRLMVMNHGGGKFSDAAFVFINGQGPCASYHFTGIQQLFDGYTRRLEPVAELVCWNTDSVQQALVRNDGSLLTGGVGELTASADGHYVFIGMRHEHSEDDRGKSVDLGFVASMVKWTLGGVNSGGPFSVHCTKARPDGASAFRAYCADPASNHGFEARIASASPDPHYERGTSWRVYNLSDPTDTADYQGSYTVMSIGNGGEPFASAAVEAKAISDHPGLVRRDGPDLVLLENGREARRMRDEGACVNWFYGKSIDLYDARKNAKAPVAEIYCQTGEFHILTLAPPYGPPQPAYQDYVASDDGKTLMVGYGSTDIIDWQSRQVLLSYPHRCDDMAPRGNDHFSARCERDDSKADALAATDFDRVDGVWTVVER